jgi:catechol 2,3-dioxygenase-like lactoylglutathione lyase family enzyme
MSSRQGHGEAGVRAQKMPQADMKLEVVVLPVSDVDRAKGFYSALGWRLDMDFVANEQYRVVQFTPPGSGCSVIFGAGITSAAPGSTQGLHLIVSDIEAARAALVAGGVRVGQPFYDQGGIFHHRNGEGVVTGLQPDRRTYGTYASFTDPDGNGWFFQEVTARLPGHELTLDTEFKSTTELARALRRAASAYGEQEAGTENPGADWADWYAEFISREQSGELLQT